MPGFGSAIPKEPSKRARANKDPNPTIRLEFAPCTPPELPEVEDIDWHPMTRRWWAVWQRSPMATLMGETDWAYMMDTALMHHAMWERGQWTLAAEVRLRLGAYGGTPADRLRLRIQWADADDRDRKIPQTTDVPDRKSSRYGTLHAITPASEKDAPA